MQIIEHVINGVGAFVVAVVHWNGIAISSKSRML